VNLIVIQDKKDFHRSMTCAFVAIHKWMFWMSEKPRAEAFSMTPEYNSWPPNVIRG